MVGFRVRVMHPRKAFNVSQLNQFNSAIQQPGPVPNLDHVPNSNNSSNVITAQPLPTACSVAQLYKPVPNTGFLAMIEQQNKRDSVNSLNAVHPPATLLDQNLNIMKAASVQNSINHTCCTGSQGIQGHTGPQGSCGLNGVDGIQGHTGAQGLQGHTGLQGIQGKNGLDGINGIDGIQGHTGLQGLQGVPGITGAPCTCLNASVIEIENYDELKLQVEKLQIDVENLTLKQNEKTKAPEEYSDVTKNSSKDVKEGADSFKSNILVYADDVRSLMQTADVYKDERGSQAIIKKVLIGEEYLTPSDPSTMSHIEPQFDCFVVPVNGVYRFRFGGLLSSNGTAQVRIRVVRNFVTIYDRSYSDCISLQHYNLFDFVWDKFQENDQCFMHVREMTSKKNYYSDVIFDSVPITRGNLTIERVR